MIRIRMSKQPRSHMTALLLDLIQNIIRIFSPTAVHYDQSAGSVLNDYRQLLSLRIMVRKHRKAARTKQGRRIRHRSRNFSEGCRHSSRRSCLTRRSRLLRCLIGHRGCLRRLIGHLGLLLRCLSRLCSFLCLLCHYDNSRRGQILRLLF